MTVFLDESNYPGINIYRVMVDYVKYDEFVSSEPLTWSEQLDVAAGYREALDGYSPMV